MTDSKNRLGATNLTAIHRGNEAAVFNNPTARNPDMGVTGTNHVVKILDLWTVRSGKAVDLWVAYFEPQALLDKLGLAHGLKD